jgi:hypothetical protein
VNNEIIRDAQGKTISSFKSSVLHTYYKLLIEEIELSEERMVQFPLDCREVMKNWWVPDI